MKPEDIFEMATSINRAVSVQKSLAVRDAEKTIERLQCSWYNVNIDYHILRKAIEDVLPKLEGYEKGRLQRAIDQVDTERQKLSRQLQTIQPLEGVAV